MHPKGIPNANPTVNTACPQDRTVWMDCSISTHRSNLQKKKNYVYFLIGQGAWLSEVIASTHYFLNSNKLVERFLPSKMHIMRFSTDINSFIEQPGTGIVLYTAQYLKINNA